LIRSVGGSGLTLGGSAIRLSAAVEGEGRPDVIMNLDGQRVPAVWYEGFGMQQCAEFSSVDGGVSH